MGEDRSEGELSQSDDDGQQGHHAAVETGPSARGTLPRHLSKSMFIPSRVVVNLVGEGGEISSGGQGAAERSNATVPPTPAAQVFGRATAESGLQEFLASLKDLVKKFEPGPSGIQSPAAAWVDPGVGGRAMAGSSAATGTPPGPAMEQAAPATEVAGVAVQEVVPKPPEEGTGEGAKKRF